MDSLSQARVEKERLMALADHWAQLFWYSNGQFVVWYSNSLINCNYSGIQTDPHYVMVVVVFYLQLEVPWVVVEHS